ncbi:MAG: L-isoaspartate O-methyltransferase [Gemmataceae bacterium]
MRSAAVDSHGNPIPWYTYPAIDLLDTKDFSTKTVLEFGSGQSTLWWAKRAKSVLSFEKNAKWHAYVRSQLPHNAEVFLISGDLTGLEDYLPQSPFDLVIIDGMDRLKAARRSIDLLQEQGAILVDNSDGYWGGDDLKEYPILELFRSTGFDRVDFYGYAPGVVLPHCTSLFFKGRTFLLRGNENVAPNKLPKG